MDTPITPLEAIRAARDEAWMDAANALRLLRPHLLEPLNREALTHLAAIDGSLLAHGHEPEPVASIHPTLQPSTPP